MELQLERKSTIHRDLRFYRGLVAIACGIATVAFISAWPAAAQSISAGAVTFQGPSIRIDGPIDQDVADHVEKAIQSGAQLDKVILDSPGGRVFPALQIARAIKAAGLNTSVSLEDECYSACSLIFLAGKQRIADGKLGVHQVSGVNDPSLTQSAIGQIYEDLVSFNTPSYLVSRMLRTPPDDMYVFSPEELERHAINIRDDSQAGSIPHLQAVETWLRKNWLVGVFMNTHTNTPFVALESREMEPLLRIVHYPKRSQTFVEIMVLTGGLSGTSSKLEFRFAHGQDQPFSLYVDADIEPNAYAFDISSDPSEAKLFWAAFTTANELTVTNSFGAEVGRYSLAGSRDAFQDFLKIAN